MTTWALRYRTDNTFDVVPFGKEQDNLKFLQEAVDGYIERFTFQIDRFAYDAWVNEDGIRLGLPVNEFGTHLYEMNPRRNGQIFGNILITGTDQSEDTPGMDDTEASALVSHMATWYLGTHPTKE